METPQDKSRTTQLIKNTLGASHTVAEVEGYLLDAQTELRAQAPYFNSRTLDKETRCLKALGFPTVRA